MQKKQCSGEMCRKHTCSSRPRLNNKTRMLISTLLDSRDTAGVERHRSVPSLPTPSHPHHHRVDCCIGIESVRPSNRCLLCNNCVCGNQWSRHTRLGRYLQFNGPTACLSSAQLFKIILSGIGASLKVDREHQVFLPFQFVRYLTFSPKMFD